MTAYIIPLVVYGCIDGIWLLGLNLELGMAGIFDFGYVLFFGLGAYIASVMSMGPANSPSVKLLSETYLFGASFPFPLPWLVALIIGGLLAWLIGMSVVRRLRGDYLAFALLAVGQGIWNIVGNNVSLFNGYTGLLEIPRPWTASSTAELQDIPFLLSVVVLFSLSLLFSQCILHSPFGRTVRAVRDREEAAQTLGKNPLRFRLSAYVCGACLAALAGALLAEYLTVWAPSAWTVNETFIALAALVIGGRGNTWGTLLGAFLVPVGFFEAVQFLPLSLDPEKVAALQWIVIGLLLLLFLWFRPQGLLPESGKRVGQSRKKLQRAPVQPTAPLASRSPIFSEPSSGVALRCLDVGYTFGGIKAVYGASFSLDYGHLLGLIGPNGAGKSTLLHCLTGKLLPAQGQVFLEGTEITAWSSDKRARQGLLRTFQLTSVFAHLTVMDNLLVAVRGQRGEQVWSAILDRWRWSRDEQKSRTKASLLLEQIGLSHLQNAPAQTLSGGEKRLLELVRALMASPKVLLLDEPFVGLSLHMVERVISLLKELQQQGVAILLIEHEPDIVARLCDQVIVMEKGTPIAKGTYQEVLNREAVQQSFIN